MWSILFKTGEAWKRERHTHWQGQPPTHREKKRQRAWKVERKQIMADHETAGYKTKKIGAGILCI